MFYSSPTLVFLHNKPSVSHRTLIIHFRYMLYFNLKKLKLQTNYKDEFCVEEFIFAF